MLDSELTHLFKATSAIGGLPRQEIGYCSLFALDYKTDSIIQSSLRNELMSDATLITVAHRLQTIMDSDKIVCRDHPLE